MTNRYIVVPCEMEELDRTKWFYMLMKNNLLLTMVFIVQSVNKSC